MWTQVRTFTALSFRTKLRSGWRTRQKSLMDVLSCTMQVTRRCTSLMMARPRQAVFKREAALATAAAIAPPCCCSLLWIHNLWTHASCKHGTRPAGWSTWTQVRAFIVPSFRTKLRRGCRTRKDSRKDSTSSSPSTMQHTRPRSSQMKAHPCQPHQIAAQVTAVATAPALRLPLSHPSISPSTQSAAHAAKAVLASKQNLRWSSISTKL